MSFYESLDASSPQPIWDAQLRSSRSSWRWARTLPEHKFKYYIPCKTQGFSATSPVCFCQALRERRIQNQPRDLTKLAEKPLWSNAASTRRVRITSGG